MPDNMAETTSRISDDASEKVNEMAENAKHMIGDYSRKAKEYARQGYQMAADKSKVLKDTTEQYVSENPWYAIGIALGVGVLLGLVLRGSSRD